MPDKVKIPSRPVEYKAHEVLIARSALLRRDSEATTDAMESLQDRIEKAIKVNHQLRAEPEKLGDQAELDQLDKELQELHAAWNSLEEGHGNMQFGAPTE